MKALRKLMTSALVLGCATVVVASPAIAWQPNKPIDFIIMAGKGGGAAPSAEPKKKAMGGDAGAAATREVAMERQQEDCNAGAARPTQRAPASLAVHDTLDAK